MALTRNIVKTLSFGIIVSAPCAYYKINYCNGDKNSIFITVMCYLDETASKTKEQIESLSYNFTPSVADDAPNFIKQGYEYLKTLDEFKDAIDA